jgi:hypothetical protein
MHYDNISNSILILFFLLDVAKVIVMKNLTIRYLFINISNSMYHDNNSNLIRILYFALDPLNNILEQINN